MDYENMQEENEVMQLAEEAGIDENWLRDFKVGMAIGLFCPAEVESKSVPIAYLYGHVAKEGETPTHTINGVDYVGAVLPDIYTVYTPELQETHPFAVMWHEESRNKYYAVVSSEPLTPINVGSYGTGFQPNRLTSVESTVTDGNWAEFESNQYIGGIGYGRWPIIWCNYDLINEDGSLFLAATVPVPVYE